MTNLPRWQTLWQRLGSTLNAAEVFAELETRYTEPQRAYHNLVHIADCLAQFDAARHLAGQPAEVEAAIWYHDVIYDPHASDNEAASAQWATERLRSGGTDEAITARIAALILATRHTAVPTEADAQLLVDIDLSILGRPPAVFDQYEQQIRREYDWVPEPAFRQGRAKILQGFLARERIYQTASFYDQFEEQARLNLARSLQQLAIS
jgi:predicted metal-dependent HD superfamily phosphohydrolase